MVGSLGEIVWGRGFWNGLLTCRTGSVANNRSAATTCNACARCRDMDELPLPKQCRWHRCGCKHQLSVIFGTTMHDSHLPLRRWFMAIYLMVESCKGIPANQLKRVPAGNYRTAWHLCRSIREAMGDAPPAPQSAVHGTSFDECCARYFLGCGHEESNRFACGDSGD